jgi:hypothetical protein
MDAALKGPRPRIALIVTALAPVVPQLLGSAFNIWYNLSVVEPLLGTEALKHRFLQTCILYNAWVYPAAMFIWLRQVLSIGPVLRELHAGEEPKPERLVRARRRAINLPWSIMAISGAAWFLCVPVFLISISSVSDAFDRRLLWHLPISFLVRGHLSHWFAPSLELRSAGARNRSGLVRCFRRNGWSRLRSLHRAPDWPPRLRADRSIADCGATRRGRPARHECAFAARR